MPTVRQPLKPRLLAVLRESSLSVPTADLIAICGGGYVNPRAMVWGYLLRLESAGVVRRTSQSPSGTRWVLGFALPAAGTPGGQP